MARPRRARWMWATLPVIGGFAVFGVIVWLAYEDTSGGPPIGDPPLIKASADSIKLPPDEAEEESAVAEGGAVGRLWSDSERPDQPERLLPLPEEPLSPPVVADRGASAEPPLGEPAAPGSPPSSATPTGDQAAAGATAAPQPARDEQAEAALDRLLAEVAALSGEQPAAPGTTTPAPSEPQASTEPPAESPPAAAPEVDTAALSEQQPAAPDATTPAPSEPEASAESPAESRQAAGEAETAALPEQQPAASTATTPAPAPIRLGASREPAAESPPAAQAETAAPAPERPAPDRPVRPSRVASEQTQPTEPPAADTPEIRRASALSGPPSPPEPAPREPARTTPTQVAAIEDNFRIQLAAVREEGDARRAWDLFSGDLRPVLSDVQPFFERAETANGIFYRVQIGPFATQEAAESLCDEIKQRNASCFVIRR